MSAEKISIFSLIHTHTYTSMKTKVSMNSAETWDILLYGETSKVRVNTYRFFCKCYFVLQVNAAKLKALLVDFMTTYVNSEEDAFKILPRYGA